MSPVTAEQLAHLVGDLDLVAHAPLGDAVREFGRPDAPAEEFGAALVRREFITGYQLERLLRGERTGYFYGRAKVLYQVGAGSFARVFRAVHRDTGAILAVKVLRSRFANDAEKQAAFRHEGEMGLLLRHPNIVAIEDVGQEQGASYINMEFVEGQTLRELVRIRGAVDLPRALDIIQQMLAGLEYAHRRGVTHRDMKASNVIVSSAGQAKLVDFGLAGVDDAGDKALGRMEKPRTIDYAALEKLTGMRDDSVRSDIYFVGTVAYLVLSGSSALAESRDRNVRADPRRFTAVEPLATRGPDLPREVVEFVGRMMHLDPLERWQTAADARRALEQIIARRAEAAERPAVATTAPAPATATTATATATATKGSVMIVESTEKEQQALRQFFTKLGYRVLVTENPQRALSRFATTPQPADCLVISARTLGVAAVEAFNTLSGDPFYAAVPAVLLTNPKQESLVAQARVDDRRRLVRMPVSTADLSRLLDDLLRPA
ncbi:MAG: protein kinase domain-containing protein [Planctomycetia bacterium]